MRNNQLIIRSCVAVVVLISLILAFRAAVIFVLGPPAPTGYSSCPIAFFISSLFMIGTAAGMGLARITDSREKLTGRILLTLAVGVLFQGIQQYGIWNLTIEPATAENHLIYVAIILSSAHSLSCIAVLLLLSFAAAWSTVESDIEPIRALITYCTIFWFGLGLAWVFLLCAFAAMI
ncbi:hypothetical protein [Planctomicrobium sp. SH527]|uniref:hypothetical protein n=1 Tax=Planctomicrobium sp. SH527 TaxID=3448123 RepID=UPI003F5AE235